jgi:hypothetical protein
MRTKLDQGTPPPPSAEALTVTSDPSAEAAAFLPALRPPRGPQTTVLTPSRTHGGHCPPAADSTSGRREEARLPTSNRDGGFAFR